MRLAKIQLKDGATGPALVKSSDVFPLGDWRAVNALTVADILHSDDPRSLVDCLDNETQPLQAGQFRWLAPIDQQEVWAAGVTYKRSQQARMEESKSGASHYDKVYTADRPELFFKATPNRVAHPGEPVGVRADSRWSVPEPEFTLVLNPSLKIVGYTIGNDMSARDIEGENPLYLPQAKVYRHCCALGPCVLLADKPPDLPATTINMRIYRNGQVAFTGVTSLAAMHRTLDELPGWLGRQDDFPAGAFLLTGTGIVPPDDFTLRTGDVVEIEIAGIGVLTNPVVQFS